MDFNGKNYYYIRNNHLLSKLNFGVSRNKYSYWSFKNIISLNLISLKKLSGKSYEIELDQKDYYKSIYCDIELFMNKIYIQYCDFNQQINSSASWSFITFYYFAFFNSTCLFRFLDKGFIFLSKEQCDNLEKFSTAMYSDSIRVDTGNYYFALKEVNEFGNIVLSLTHKGDSVHKSTWIQLESTLNEFKLNSDQDEAIIYSSLLSRFKDLNSEFPSNIRNKLNYNGESSILDFCKELPIFKLFEFSKLDLKDIVNIKFSSNSTINSIESLNYLTSYIFQLNLKLYNEFIERSSYGKDFEKERNDYLIEKRVKIK